MKEYIVHVAVIRGLIELLEELEQLGHLIKLLETDTDPRKYMFSVSFADNKDKTRLVFPRGVVDFEQMRELVDARISLIVDSIKQNYKFDPSETSFMMKYK